MRILDRLLFIGLIGTATCAQAVDLMVEPGGIEPPTSCMPYGGSLEAKALGAQGNPAPAASNICAPTGAVSTGFSSERPSDIGRPAEADSGPPLSALPEHPQPYPSAEGAATAALLRALPASRGVEFAGAILECGGRYYPTSAVIGERDRVEWRLARPNHCRLAGIYHTHSDREQSAFFGAQDVAQAQQLGVPSWLGVFRDGTIRVFDPKRMRPRRERHRLRAGSEHAGRVIAIDGRLL